MNLFGKPKIPDSETVWFVPDTSQHSCMVEMVVGHCMERKYACEQQRHCLISVFVTHYLELYCLFVLIL